MSWTCRPTWKRSRCQAKSTYLQNEKGKRHGTRRLVQYMPSQKKNFNNVKFNRLERRYHKTYDVYFSPSWTKCAAKNEYFIHKIECSCRSISLNEVYRKTCYYKSYIFMSREADIAHDTDMAVFRTLLYNLYLLYKLSHGTHILVELRSSKVFEISDVKTTLSWKLFIRLFRRRECISSSIDYGVATEDKGSVAGKMSSQKWYASWLSYRYPTISLAWSWHFFCSPASAFLTGSHQVSNPRHLARETRDCFSALRDWPSLWLGYWKTTQPRMIIKIHVSLLCRHCV